MICLISTDNEKEDTSQFSKGQEKPQSFENTGDQSVMKHNKDVSPTEKVVSDLETNQITVSDCTHIDEDLVEVISSYGHEEIKVDQEQPLNTEMEFKTVNDELSASSSCKISKDPVNTFEEMSIPDQEAIPRLHVNNSECNYVDKGHAQTDIAKAKDKTTLLTVSTIVNNQEEGDLDDSNLTSDEIATHVQVQDSSDSAISIGGLIEIARN